MAHPLELLQQAKHGGPIAMLHGAGWDQSLLCTEAVDVLTLPAAGWPGAFDRLDAFVRTHEARTTIGWLGFDLGLDVEPWPIRLADDLPVPVLFLAAFARVQAFAPAPPPPPPPVPPAGPLRAHATRAEYERRVAAVVEHIRAGDIFQANLSQPFTGAFTGEPRQLFWRLCAASPSPFGAYIEDGHGTAVLSSSPEEFLRKDGDIVRTRPIKGTRPRGADAIADARLLHELQTSPKDQAELAMIVDLLRNDLGKVAATGSVAVGPFPEAASFAQVHHLFATITARLQPAVSTADVLRATFPGGSITGCPKLRCLEILEQLEVVRRGVYTGAIGRFGPGLNLHLNVAIRTLVYHRGRIRGNAGGGITALSEPAAEYDETLHKMRGLLLALQTHIGEPVAGPP